MWKVIKNEKTLINNILSLVLGFGVKILMLNELGSGYFFCF